MYVSDLILSPASSRLQLYHPGSCSLLFPKLFTDMSTFILSLVVLVILFLSEKHPIVKSYGDALEVDLDVDV